MQEIDNFFDSLIGPINRLIQRATADCLRARVYEVTAPPQNGSLGVRLPCSAGAELRVPYDPALSGAKPGQCVMVVYRGSFLNPIALPIPGKRGD